MVNVFGRTGLLARTVAYLVGAPDDQDVRCGVK
jgi:hypothetical protein